MINEKKALIINASFSKGGAGKVARMLHNALNKTSHFSSYFVYGRGEKVNDGKAIKFAWQLEVYFHAFLTRITGLQGYGSYLSTRKLESLVLKEKFDLIHLHNLHGYYLNLSFIEFLGRLKIPIIWTLHDYWPITGRCAYSFECNRWRTGCGHCSNLSWYPKSHFDSSSFMWKKKKEYFSSQWNPVIICPSRWLAEKVKGSYLGKFRIQVIPNGIDTEIFKPKDKSEIRQKLGIGLDQRVILIVAANLKEERKGTKYFFEALRFIKFKKCIILTIGGKTNNKMIKIPIKLEQLGYMSEQSAISDVYNAADVFCISSLEDNFPSTVLESMACGTPVVGFKVGGIPEQVTSDCGILVEPRDVKSLAVAIDQLLSDDEKRKAFSMRCQERILENYPIEKFKERYINLYKHLLR